MSKDPWVKFYPSDFLSGVAALSAAERGVYITLLSAMYDHAAPLKREDARLARLCGIPIPGFSRALDGLIAAGKIAQSEGLIFNSRAKKEIEDRSEKRARSQDAGFNKWGSERDDANKLKRSERLSAARALATHTRTEWAAMTFAFPLCVLCSDSEAPVVKDHIIPVYQGGSDGIENLQPLCQRCNASKGPDNTDHRPSDWRGRIDLFINKINGEMPAKRLSYAGETPSTCAPVQSLELESDKNLVAIATSSTGAVDLFQRQSKKLEKSQSDEKLLNDVTDAWNRWAVSHGCPQVKYLTGTRAKHCRNRIADITNGHGPIAAFEELLGKCEQSFFVKGSPRSPLKFDQLMTESFLVKMMEGSFEHRATPERNGTWRR